MTPKLKVLLAVAGGTLALDQALKVWTQHHFAGSRDRVVLIPNWLELVHAENPGAAFSAFADFSEPVRMGIFAVFTIIALGALLQMFRQLGAGERLRSASIAFILAGALGNGIDRLYKQSVTDMFKMFWGPPGSVRTWLQDTVGTNVWPIWNIADAAILVGVSMFLLEFLFEKDEAQIQEKDVGDNPLDRQDAAANG